jgi:hypothetical protein
VLDGRAVAPPGVERQQGDASRGEHEAEHGGGTDADGVPGESRRGLVREQGGSDEVGLVAASRASGERRSWASAVPGAPSARARAPIMMELRMLRMGTSCLSSATR